jgi:hypothetical protein
MGTFGKTVGKAGEKVAQGLGLKQVDPGYQQETDQVQNMLMQRANAPSQIAQKQYEQMANQGLGKVLATIASQRSLAPSEQANLAARTNRDMQLDIAGQGGLIGLQDQADAQKTLAELLLARQGQSVNSQNAGFTRLTSALGAGASAMGSGGAKKGA